MNASPREVVEQYWSAWQRGDLAATRQLLHDNLSFKGPFDTFSRADDFHAAITALHPMVKSVEQRRMFVDGDDVCVISNMTTNTPAGVQPVVEWFTVRGDKIASIRAYFDTAPFAALRP
jgi:ketosteroid isomerase-like protein